jgi:hypothetical protein
MEGFEWCVAAGDTAARADSILNLCRRMIRVRTRAVVVSNDTPRFDPVTEQAVSERWATKWLDAVSYWVQSILRESTYRKAIISVSSDTATLPESFHLGQQLNHWLRVRERLPDRSRAAGRPRQGPDSF